MSMIAGSFDIEFTDQNCRSLVENYIFLNIRKQDENRNLIKLNENQFRILIEKMIFDGIYHATDENIIEITYPTTNCKIILSNNP